MVVDVFENITQTASPAGPQKTPNTYCGSVQNIAPLEQNFATLQAAGAAVTTAHHLVLPKGGKRRVELTYRAVIKFLQESGLASQI